jgi:hypothetical protein
VTPQAVAATQSETNPNAPKTPLTDKNGRRLTAQERAALTPTIAPPTGKVAHDALATVEGTHPTTNAKRVPDASVQKSPPQKPKAKARERKGAARAPNQKAAPKEKIAPAPKVRASRVPGRIAVLEAKDGADTTPINLVCHAETLKAFRAQMGETTVGECVRGWLEAHPKLGTEPMPPGSTIRTVYIPTARVRHVLAAEKAEDVRLASLVYAQMRAAVERKHK